MYAPETYASRNIALCTKDCLCLFVCPTGATDTENGQVDASKCMSGCRLCVDACPSHALSLMYRSYPAQQEKTDRVVEKLMALANSKVALEGTARTLAESAESAEQRTLAKAIALSARISAEDLYREARYMLPQSDGAKDLLRLMLDEETGADFPKEAAEALLATL
ncbi:4Fe-4S ferredoxin [Raoultibacter phocaeensis]|uniref:4Fe-4S ferredoxin n=1 Tax=Raoultibacter phocaeensis TaxID=2479841 RepID=UPI0011188C38|nr:4Fe-4S ferredoxin [Raoultibacter phocaeensis]